MKQELREQILSVVKDLYAKYAYGDVSMSQILAAAGISKGAFYWYFKSKEEAFSAAFEECYQAAVKAAHSFDRSGMDAVSILKARLLALIRLDREDPRLLAVLNHHFDYLRSRGIEPYPYGDFKEDVDALVHQGIREGVFRELPADFLTHMTYLFNSELVSFLQLHPSYYENPELLGQMADTLFSSLLKDGGQRRPL